MNCSSNKLNFQKSALLKKLDLDMWNIFTDWKDI